MVKRKARPPIDWPMVEEAIRRSVRGRATDADRQSVCEAYDHSPDHYAELSRRVRKEEQDAYIRSGGIS